MTLIVGYATDGGGSAVLHLAAMLARSAKDDVVVCSVVPAPWVPGMARIDAEYQAFLDRLADAALADARQRMPADVPTTYVRHRARSAPTGLLEVAAEHDAHLVVLGSSCAGPFGHVALGSVSDRLLHSSPVMTALAPRGFRSGPAPRIARVTAACGGSEAAERLVVAAAGLAVRLDAALRVASFAVWQRPDYTSRLGTEPEDLVLREWTARVEEAANAALKQVSEMPAAPRHVETVVGRGDDWEQAIEDVEWHDGDLLSVGSSEAGPVAAVFLGSRATKIVRHSPVPVVVVPRGMAEELAERLAQP
jgi:nucleotide-binding universal stress UspA family protein